MLEGTSPSIERKRPNKFEEKEGDKVSINIMENMYNQKSNDKTGSKASIFGATPSSIKLSDKEKTIDAFRVSMLVYDMLMTDEINCLDENLDIFERTNKQEENIFLDDIFEFFWRCQLFGLHVVFSFFCMSIKSREVFQRMKYMV